MMIPSVAGVWDLRFNPASAAAADNLAQSIAPPSFWIRVVLVAFFRRTRPYERRGSYGRWSSVEARRAIRGRCRSTLDWRTPEPGDNRKLLELVNHPSVKVYYDIHNMAHYGYAAEAISGIKLLGPDRICQVTSESRSSA